MKPTTTESTSGKPASGEPAAGAAEPSSRESAGAAAAAEKLREYVLRVLLREPTTTTESITAVFQSFLPVRIVQLSFLRIAQHLVRLGDFFKLLLRRALVVGVFILRSPVRARQLARSASRNDHHPPSHRIARRRSPSPSTKRFDSRRLGPDLIAPSIRSRARASRVARTGCHFIANFLYALRISFSSASREMPSAA